jgi:hypothetical protein
MVKQLILYFNLISLSFITILLSDGIEIETNLPKEVVKDSTYIIDVVIKKGDLFGFAKYQQNFPEGFDAKPVETAEASFTYADGKMKFIWMALPEDEEVRITYALTAYDGAPVEAVVAGKFSYIADNQRKSYDIPNQTIAIKSAEPEEERIPAIASVNRVVKPLANNTYEVSLTIDKQGVYGFSKLEEYLPSGAEAEVLNNQKAVFSQVDERAKFVWMSIPEDETLTVTYKVKANEDIGDALRAMEGNFAYLDESETKSVAVMSDAPLMADNASSEETIETPVDEAPDETPVQPAEEAPEEVAEVEAPVEMNEEVAAVTEEETPVEEPVEEVAEVAPEPVKQTPVKPAKKKPVTAIPDPETGISYRVQIIAGHKMVDEAYVKKTYKYNDGFITFDHEGWIKYLTADDYAVYKEARDKREALIAAQHNFPGPFVTAYNAGERITVQEALMITNQQWFQ